MCARERGKSAYTHKQVLNVFAELCQAVNKRVGIEINDVGAWLLRFNREFGGYIICEMGEEFVHYPFGNRRYTRDEIILAMRFAIEAVELHKEHYESQRISHETL